MSKYKGSGTFETLVKNASDIIDALNNAKLEMPALGSDIASFEVEGSGSAASLVLDLSNAPVFGLGNVRVTAPYPINKKAISVVNNALVVRLDITVS